MKTVYVVYGSEDGVLGVYSTPRKAWLRAFGYCNEHCQPMEAYHDLKRVLAESEDFDNVKFIVTAFEKHTAEITKFFLNN